MSNSTSWLYNLIPVVLCVLALALLPRVIRRLEGLKEARLASTGQLALLIGFVGIFLSWVLPASSVRRFVAVAFVLGAVAGAFSARAETTKWELEIQREGRLEAAIPRKPWWSSQPVASILLLGAILLSLFSPLKTIAEPLLAIVGGGASGILTVGGGWVWLWARKKERELHKPLARPIRRD